MEIYTPGIDANYQAQLEVEAARMRQQSPSHELRLTAAEIRSCTSPIDDSNLKTYDSAHYFFNIPQNCEVPALPFILKLAELNDTSLNQGQINSFVRQLTNDEGAAIWENGDQNIALDRGIRSQNDTRDPVEINVTNPDFSETTLKANPEAIVEIINEVAVTTSTEVTPTPDDEPSATPAISMGVKAQAYIPIAPSIIQPTPRPTASPEEIQAYDTKINSLKALLGWLASIGGIGIFAFVIGAVRSQKREKVKTKAEVKDDSSIISKRVFKNPKALSLDEGLVAGTTSDPTRGYKVRGGAIHAKGFDPKGIQIAQKLDEVAFEITSNPDKYPTGRGGRIPLPTAQAAIKAVEDRKNK